MSKIVCDVCGSSYSETEAYCPICGTKRSEEAKPVVETTAEERPVKAGKYSQSQTNKTGSGTTRRTGNERGNNSRSKQDSNTGMIVIVAILLLAIVAVCVFIVLNMLGDRNDDPVSTGDGYSTSAPNEDDPSDIACTGIELEVPANENLVFTDKDQAAIQLTVKAIPENSTEKIVCSYTSSNPAVVGVDNFGNVTPVGNGTATITIAYKDFTITVNVTCNLVGELTLTSNDITISPSKPNENLYKGSLNPADITWTSSDTSIATVKDGVVTGIKDGIVTITATYGTKTAECKVRVSGFDKANKAVYALHGGWSYGDDFTMKLNETIKLTLRNKSDNSIVTGLQWHISNDFETYCKYTVQDDGIVKITGIKSTGKGLVKIWTEYEGEKYECIIRVSSTTAK